MTLPHSPASDSASARRPQGLAGPLVLLTLIVVAALSRVLPHPPNFSPVEAIALFGGAYFLSRTAALLVPLAGMLASDIALAAINGSEYASWFGSTSIYVVYLCIALTSLLGMQLRGRVSSGRVLGYSLAGSVMFFLVTNAAVWAGDVMYPRTLGGLGQAYLAGVPFFQWTLLGTLFYSALLFGGFALLRRQVPALRAQTA